MLRQAVTHEEFLESVFIKSNSMNSRKQAEKALKKWVGFLKLYYSDDEISILEELRQKQGDPIVYQMLNRFVAYLTKQGLKRNTINGYFNQVKAWLRFNAIRIHTDDVKEFVSFPRQPQNRNEPLSDEVMQKIAELLPPKFKAFWYFLNTTGIRPDREVLRLTINNIDFDADPVRIIIPSNIAKTGMERITFCPKKIGDMVREHITSEFIFDFGYMAFYTEFRKAVKKLGLKGVVPYKARKRVRTKLSVIDKDFGELIIGHKNISNLYYEKSDDELAQIYKRAESTLLQINS